MKCNMCRQLRGSKKEPVFKEPEVDVIYLLDEVQVVLTLQVADQMEAVLPKQDTEVEHKIARLDCGKQMSVNILKCSHGPNCVIQQQNQSQPTRISREDGDRSLVAEGTKEQEYQSQVQNIRMECAARREGMMQQQMKNPL